MPIDEPTYIATERMPELAADIRLVLKALEDAAYASCGDYAYHCEGERESVAFFVHGEPYEEAIIAAYDRLKAAFGKDD